MENFDLKKHSTLFNKYYCIIENSDQLDLYYKGVSDFLKYKFKKILLTNNQNLKENKITDPSSKYELNQFDENFLNKKLSKI